MPTVQLIGGAGDGLHVTVASHPGERIGWGGTAYRLDGGPFPARRGA